jgi:hypothetical protein
MTRTAGAENAHLSAYTTGTMITIDGGAANRGPMF